MKTRLLVIGGLIVYIVSSVVYDQVRYFLVQKKANKKLKHRNSKTVLVEVPRTSKYVLSLSAQEIACSSIPSQEILNTYIHRVLKVARPLNLTAEEPFEDALSRLDSLPKGLLYKVPISFKDEIFQENCTSSGGVTWRLDEVNVFDSILVKLLRDQGAVPFVRGNAMQLMMWIETTNNIYGTSLNPWDPTRTPGGSSGGDAGLVASRCTPLAIGSDIAGSVRIPSAFCGVYGFKPGSYRVSYKECAGCYPDGDLIEELIRPSYGPMGRSVEDLALVLRSWWVPQLWEHDPYVFPLVFDEQQYQSTEKLKIGYFEYNEVFECAEVVKNVVRDSKNKLEQQGHTLVPFDTSMIRKGVELCLRVFMCMGGSHTLEGLKGERPAWPYFADWLESKVPFVSSLLLKLLDFSGHHQLAYLLNVPSSVSVSELNELVQEISEFKNQFIENWRIQGLDCVISPVWGLVAPQHTKTQMVIASLSYCFLWNLLDFPAGVVPVKLVEKGEDHYTSSLSDKVVEEAQCIMEGSVGLPVCLQVVSLPNKDETALKLMKALESTYNFHKYPL